MGDRVSSFIRRLFNRNNQAVTRWNDGNNAEAKVKDGTASDIEEKEEEVIDISKIEIKYKSSSKKLDLTSQQVLNNDLFYKALSMHENPLVLRELTLMNKPNVVSIPVLIGQFDNLVTLNLCNNGLTDLPWSVLYLRKLENLDLSQNCFRHIPRIVGHLEELRELSFRQNRLLTIPTELLKLKKLQKLDLMENDKLKGITTDQIKKGVNTIFEIIQKRQNRSDLWANSSPWFGYNAAVAYGSSTLTLHELAVSSILSHKVNFLHFDTVPPKLKTLLAERAEEYRNRIKVAKCSNCKYYYSSKEMFENHICQAG